MMIARRKKGVRLARAVSTLRLCIKLRKCVRDVLNMAVYAAYRHIELDNVGYGKKRTRMLIHCPCALWQHLSLAVTSFEPLQLYSLIADKTAHALSRPLRWTNYMSGNVAVDNNGFHLLVGRVWSVAWKQGTRRLEYSRAHSSKLMETQVAGDGAGAVEVVAAMPLDGLVKLPSPLMVEPRTHQNPVANEIALPNFKNLNIGGGG
uniref:Uncharacterized protein n=1 Tax=Timema shepardi TaxID=629360 RepID=A0A7R9ART8_TIMSH|nr:unnamed protein product [Timema shepardi]